MAQELVIGGKVIKPGTMILNTNGFANKGQMCKFLGISGRSTVWVQTFSQCCDWCKSIEVGKHSWSAYIVSGTIREVVNGADKTLRLAEYWEKYAQSWSAYLSHIRQLTCILRDDAVTPQYYQDICREVFEEDRRAAFGKHTERLFALKREYSDVL